LTVIKNSRRIQRDNGLSQHENTHISLPLRLHLVPRFLQVEAACHLYDKDHNDSLDREEFADLLTHGGFGISKKDVPALVEEADKNGDGIIQYEEFLPAMVKVLSKDAKPLELDKGKMGLWAAEKGYYTQMHPRKVACLNSRYQVDPPGGVWEKPRANYFTRAGLPFEDSQLPELGGPPELYQMMDTLHADYSVKSVKMHIVRHGEVHNPEKIMYGRLTGHRLSDEGESQAIRVGSHLAVNHPEIGAVYSSPMQRAHATAFEVSKNLPNFVTARQCGQTPIIKVERQHPNPNPNPNPNPDSS